MRPGPAGEVSKQWDLLCALPVPPLVGKVPAGLSWVGGWDQAGQEERQGWGQAGQQERQG